MLEIGRQAKQLGFTHLGVTGGETFLQPDMPEILARLADLLPTVALTNATLFGRRLLDRVTPLAGRDVALQISLDRPDPDVNDAMRAPSNFRKVVTAIPALVERGITVRIATTVESIEDAELDRSVRAAPRSGRARLRARHPTDRAPRSCTGARAGCGGHAVRLARRADRHRRWRVLGPFGPTVRDGRVATDLFDHPHRRRRWRCPLGRCWGWSRTGHPEPTPRSTSVEREYARPVRAPPTLTRPWVLEHGAIANGRDPACPRSVMRACPTAAGNPFRCAR